MFPADASHELKFFPILPISQLNTSAREAQAASAFVVLCPANRENGNTMPVDFGEITAYHHEEAARHRALAQAARDRGCPADADYQAGLAARWDEVAQQQKIDMRQAPSRRMAMQRPHRPQPPPMPFVVACLLAVVRGFKQIAAAFRPPATKRSVPINGLSLR
jgi:hypothetical protein